MFKRFYKKPALVTVAAYVVRDSRTKQIIARGDYAKCIAYQNAFGLCFVEAA